ncbi:hypothetical protein PVAP13_7NG376800 [Panicum virgatum]|uniref:AB hydrolase-1 domain-containing protein n=1 Tax=Panicum virgatum TaxID=38727 RepID=A0A8T0QGD8_PANVG|nr:hypothetical protein PVAP13_7NG376800 [Panicum virgatum]
MPRCCPCATSSSPALFLLPTVPASSTSKTTSSSRVALAPCDGAFSCVSGRLRWGTRPRGRYAIVAASGKDGSGTAEEEKEKDEPGFNPFGFVTDNPSSRSAIQLPAVPAEDGNVGQMLYRIEDKGREYGSYVRSREFRWFVRETGSPDARRGTIVFLHGAPTQSFSYRVVMAQMLATTALHLTGSDLGSVRCHNLDMGSTLKRRSSTRHLMIFLGFLVGSYGLTWALNNSSKVLKLAILNSPLTVSSPVPGLFQQLKWPLVGEFTCQNAVLAERFIEAGSAYVLKLEKADVYRLPYLSSGAPGFALLEAARKVNFQDVLRRISSGFSSNSWEKPILLAWGISDKYLPLSIAEEFKKANPNVVKLEAIEGAGHMPQEDWPEKVVKALIYFL